MSHNLTGGSEEQGLTATCGILKRCGIPFGSLGVRGQKGRVIVATESEIHGCFDAWRFEAMVVRVRLQGCGIPVKGGIESAIACVTTRASAWAGKDACSVRASDVRVGRQLVKRAKLG